MLTFEKTILKDKRDRALPILMSYSKIFLVMQTTKRKFHNFGHESFSLAGFKVRSRTKSLSGLHRISRKQLFPLKRVSPLQWSML